VIRTIQWPVSKGFGCFRITLGSQLEVDELTVLVDRRPYDPIPANWTV
jgi:hypothetical protein